MNVEMAELLEMEEAKQRELVFRLWIKEVEEKREDNKYNRFEIMEIDDE